MDIEDILIIGGLLYVYFVYSRPSTFSTVPGGVPGSGGGIVSTSGPGGGDATVVTSPYVTQPQTIINQQIVGQGQEIAAGAGLATAVVGSLVSLNILAASVAGPIGAAIAAVALLIKNLISDTHLYANQLVQKYENPFGQYVIQIIQAVTDELNANTLTLADATAARDAVTYAWENYQSIMQQIRTQGPEWYIVATQSLNNLDNQYLGETLPNGKVLGAGEGGAYGDQLNYGFMSTWLDWLNGRVSDLGGA